MPDRDRYNPTLRHKLTCTCLRPLFDARVLLLLVVSAFLLFLLDPAAATGLLSLALYVICAWGAALCVTKIIMPYVRMSDLYRRAAYDSRSAARVYEARTYLLIAVALTLVFWSK